MKDSLENRLKREGYVEGIVENNNKTYYKITPKGKKLLKSWISFLSGYKSDHKNRNQILVTLLDFENLGFLNVILIFIISKHRIFI